MVHRDLVVGLSSAVAVLFIWSGFLVFSRAGVTTNLTVYDVTGLRFLVAGLIVLPFVNSWWPRHLPLKAIVVISVCGPGVLYTLLVYLGLKETSAAFGGVFTNGSLPIFVLAIAFGLDRERPGKWQIVAITLIVSGGVLIGYRGMASGGTDVAAGILLFLTASAVLSAYFIGIGRWQITPRQALVLVTVPNAVVFLPIWIIFLPTGLPETEFSTVLFQALFQGIGPGFLAIIFFSLAVKHLGAAWTAGFSAVVPATAALLAIPVLSEVPSTLEWIGIVTVCLGLGVLVSSR